MEHWRQPGAASGPAWHRRPGGGGIQGTGSAAAGGLRPCWRCPAAPHAGIPGGRRHGGQAGAGAHRAHRPCCCASCQQSCGYHAGGRAACGRDLQQRCGRTCSASRCSAGRNTCTGACPSGRGWGRRGQRQHCRITSRSCGPGCFDACCRGAAALARCNSLLSIGQRSRCRQLHPRCSSRRPAAAADGIR